LTGRKRQFKKSQVDAIIFSPPFADQQSPHRGGGNIGFVRPSKDGKIGTDEKDKCWFLSENKSNIGNLPHGNVDAVIFSPPFEQTYFYYGKKPHWFWEKLAQTTGRKAWLNPNSKTRQTINAKEKELSINNISNLPHGNVDVIVTSPPYSECEHHKEHGLKDLSGEGFKGRKSWRNRERVKVSKQNVGSLKHGEIDTIIFSPPYKTEMRGAGLNKNDKGLELGCKWDGYSGNPENIDNKPYGEVDVIVTSPPYGETCNESKNTTSNLKREERIILHGHDPKSFFGGKARNCQLENGLRYSFEKGNIGNLRHNDSILATHEEEQVSNVLFFEPTAGFHGFEQFFHKDSVRHPAKANLRLLRWILERYTKEGDLILDPMSGTFSTNIMASYLNRRSIGVELEEKFCVMGKKNLKRFLEACKFWKVTRPSFTILQGDSRKLSEVLKEQTDAIVTSPPYGNHLSDDEVKDNDPQRMSYQQALGKLDAVIFSLPYSDSKKGEAEGETFADAMEKHGSSEDSRRERHTPGRLRAAKALLSGYSKSEQNIGNLEHGSVDTIITSPPYAESKAFHDLEFMKRTSKEQSEKVRKGEIKGHYMTEEARTKVFERMEEDKTETKDNIACLPHGKVDMVITRPPYEEGIGHGGKRRTKVLTRDKGIWLQGKGSYSLNKENVGEMRGETYLSAMIKVYAECFKVLKLHGLLILIIKNFIRKKTVVRLDLDTIRLCEHVGFKLKERWYRQLKEESFWRVLYRKKFPTVPRIRYEHILVFEKI